MIEEMTTQRSIRNLADSIESLRSTTRRSFWFLVGLFLLMAFALVSRWHSLQHDWFLTLLIGCLTWSLLSGFRTASYSRKILPMLEQKLKEKKRMADTA